MQVLSSEITKAETKIAPKVLDFEGTKLTAHFFGGQYVFLAREVSLALGYHDASKLGEQIRVKWSEEFIEGKDFAVVTGEALSELKSRLTPQSGVSEIDRSPSLMLLTKDGVNLACLKTRNPIGKKMRRWLSSEVLPSLEATGKYETIPQAPQPIAFPEEFKQLFQQQSRTLEVMAQMVNLLVNSQQARPAIEAPVDFPLPAKPAPSQVKPAQGELIKHPNTWRWYSVSRLMSQWQLDAQQFWQEFNSAGGKKKVHTQFTRYGWTVREDVVDKMLVQLDHKNR